MGLLGSILGGIGSLISGNSSAKAAKQAAQLQYNSTEDALHQQAAQWAAAQANEQPFISAGTSALGQQGNLIGLNGNDAQTAAITALQNSPYYQSLYRNGLQANLANASATGGLRGGNETRSLANFGADTLAQTIQQQLANLGGLTGLGANAAAGLGNLGQENANAQSGILQAGGAAQAGGVLGAQASTNAGWNNAFAALAPALNNLNLGGLSLGNNYGLNTSFAKLF